MVFEIAVERVSFLVYLVLFSFWKSIDEEVTQKVFDVEVGCDEMVVCVELLCKLRSPGLGSVRGLEPTVRWIEEFYKGHLTQKVVYETGAFALDPITGSV